MDLIYTLFATSPYFPSYILAEDGRMQGKHKVENPSNYLCKAIKWLDGNAIVNHILPTQEEWHHLALPEQIAAEFLMAYYEADFCKVEQSLQSLSHWADSCKDPKAKTLRSIAQSMYWSDMAMYSNALQELERAAQFVQIEDAARAAILSAKRAWIYILTDQLELARAYVESLTKAINPTIKAQYQMLAGIIHYVEGNEANAEENFLVASNYYKAQENLAALSVIRLYQASLYLNSGSSLYKAHLHSSLQWMDENERLYVPYWWHPNAFDAILNKAIDIDYFAKRAKAIQGRQQKFDQQTTEHRTIANNATSKARHVTHSRRSVSSPKREMQLKKASEIIETLIINRTLHREQVSALGRHLPHGINKQQINPAIIAVFGLHIQGISNSEIALSLALTRNTVKTYITKIYSVFELPIDEFPNAAVRRLHLVEMAKEEGYVGDLLV